MSDQEAQLTLIKKLYSKYGMELKITCSACPEQYEVFKNGNRVAYLRLRHGYFTVTVPDVSGVDILEAHPNGDGIFKTHERLRFMTDALRSIVTHYKP